MFSSNGFLFLHIAISLIAIAAGFVFIGGILARSDLPRVRNLFLTMTIATNVTGLMFPFSRFLPSHGVAILSLVLLAIALYAHYFSSQTVLWRRVFVGASVVALYLNVFVLIVQTFLKNPGLSELAPTQSELPFIFAQTAALVCLAYIGVLAVKRTTTTLTA